MYCCCCAAGFYSCLLMCIRICVRVHVYVCVYIKQRIHKICVCADAAALAWLPWPGLVSDFVPRPLSLSLSLPSCRFSSLSSLLSHKLCLILLSPSLLLHTSSLCLPLLQLKVVLQILHLALSLSLCLSSLSNSNVDCDCGSHFNALLFVFVAAAAAAATAGSSASFSFYFPVSAAQIPSPVCTRFVIAFNKNSCCSLLVSPPFISPLSLFYTASHSYTFITALLRCRRRALSLSSSAALDKCLSLSDDDGDAPKV